MIDKKLRAKIAAQARALRLAEEAEEATNAGETLPPTAPEGKP